MDTRAKAKAYLSGVILYGLAILIYFFFPFYRDFISANTHQAILYLYLTYVVVSFFWFNFSPRAKAETRALIFWRAAARSARSWVNFFKNPHTAGLPNPELTKEEKVTLLFFLVKFFFTPIMINFLFGNTLSVWGSGQQLLSGNIFNQADQTRLIYFTILNVMLTVDTAFFVLGYLFEFKSWGNEVRSVEPTVFGWVVALACYPPFNGVVSQVIGWGSSDYGVFSSPAAVLITVYSSLVLFFVYVWATVALGLKSSNLTNRGIVDRGPYAYVRHPAYISKNLHWLIMGLPIIVSNWWALFSIIAWAFIYFLRALTEERHLLADPDYQAYCRKVPYRFIPGII
jgi:protein-S-isoprenylcysteine O-methyltransferase Ste14